MALNLGIRLALAAEGFTEAQIAQIEAALPVLTRLMAAYKASSHDILTIIPVVEMIIKQVEG